MIGLDQVLLSVRLKIKQALKDRQCGGCAMGHHFFRIRLSLNKDMKKIFYASHYIIMFDIITPYIISDTIFYNSIPNTGYRCLVQVQ